MFVRYTAVGLFHTERVAGGRPSSRRRPLRTTGRRRRRQEALGTAHGTGITHTHTHTHTFNDPFSGTTRVSRYQKGKTNLDFFLKRETVSASRISWANSAPCSRQTTTPAPHHSVFTGRMPFLPPNQQRQSTEGTGIIIIIRSVAPSLITRRRWWPGNTEC